MQKRNFADLRDFVNTLEKEGELLRINARVSPYLEITEITNIVCKSPGGGKALLFENVEGSSFPVLTNAFGSKKRICMALGVEGLDELAARVQKFLHLEPPKTLGDALNFFKVIGKIPSFFPRTFRGKAPCQEVVYKGKEVNISKVPILTCWPKDGGPFVTLPVVITKSLETGKRNAGMYRLQVFDSRTTGMHWHIHKDGSHYFEEYRKRGLKMPVAVAIGVDPATIYAATAPLPRGVDEFVFSGFIREKPVQITKCVTVDLEVPAMADFVLEGYVNPNEFRIEGPFGDHTGYYSLEDKYPVFHITAITHRKDAIYPATIVGRPPMEDCYLAKATERIFLPMLQLVFPEIVDYWLPWEGVFHNITVVAIDKFYPGHAHKIMHGMWSQGQMAFCKIIVVVDENVDLKTMTEKEQYEDFVRYILNTVDFEQDLLFSEGILDVLDHSAPEPLYGSKLGIDVTRRCAGERSRNHERLNYDVPENERVLKALKDIEPGIQSFRVPFKDVLNRPLIFNIVKDGRISVKNIAPVILEHPDLLAFSVFVAFDKDIDLCDGSLLFWKLFNNVDPRRDITMKAGRIVIDATKKGPEDGHNRPWPDDIVMDSSVKERVRKRARELGIESYITDFQ